MENEYKSNWVSPTNYYGATFENTEPSFLNNFNTDQFDSTDYIQRFLNWKIPTSYTLNETNIMPNFQDLSTLGKGSSPYLSNLGNGFNPLNGLSWDKFKSSFDNLFVKQDPKTGKTSLGTGALLGKLALDAFSAWQGKQQTDLMKKQLNFQKNAFNNQYNNQVQLLNNQMEAQQKSAYAADPTHFQSPADYMATHKIK